MQTDHLQQLAFERGRRFGDVRHGYVATRCRCKAREFEFVDVGRDRRGGAVHLLGERLAGQIPDEFASGLDVGDAVFAAFAAEADDRRGAGECAEETVGREVQRAVGGAGGNPADQARSDDGLERVVRKAVAGGGVVEVVGHG